MIPPTSQMRKLRPREVKYLVYCDMSQNWGSRPGLSLQSPRPEFLNLC